MWSFRASARLLALASLSQYAWAQTAPVSYTDPDTGIILDTWTSGGVTLGFALPEDALTTDSSEYIGYLKCTTASQAAGYCGISLGGSMNNKLLIVAYPYKNEILTAFQWSTGYGQPLPYAGSATLKQVSSKINKDSFELLYRCQDCLKWNHNGSSGSASTSSGSLLLGWAVGSATPTNAQCPADARARQHKSAGIISGGLTSNAANSKYKTWAALATKVVAGDCGGASPTTTTTAVPDPTGTPVPTGAVYDYVVVGGGAGGIPVADKLSESGKKVLLIEKGPPSTAAYGGTMGPTWIRNANLTRFDVPGLCNQIWVDSDGIACKDVDQMAGCVLGGGTAINAGLWWKPLDEDWEYNFPEGWKASDMAPAVERVFSRIPGTRRSSQDGIRHYPEGYNILSGGVKQGGWTEFDPYKEPNNRNHTYTDGAFMFIHGERGGALATYLNSATKRHNFDLWTNTQATKIVRTGGHATGVKVKPYLGEGYVGTVQLTPNTGRVVVSAGAFGSPKLLMRSGIGPQDQLEIVAGSADAEDFIADHDWILLPVGYNLEDHTNTDAVVSHPDVKSYDFYAAWDDPIKADAKAYLDNRAGILAQAAPNIGPIMYDEILGGDGIVRTLQWTSRVEPSLELEDKYALTMSQYLGRGAKSRGRMAITSDLNTVVKEKPYLHFDEDTEAIIRGLDNMRKALSGVQNLTWLAPLANQTSRDYVNAMATSGTGRGANHWIGTNRLGTDDGRKGGDAVVDLDTKVYGTDNIFVVDASIIPGMVTPNIQSYIVTIAERAAERILNLKA